MTQLSPAEALMEIPLFSMWSNPYVSLQFMLGLVESYDCENFIAKLYKSLLQNLSPLR